MNPCDEFFIYLADSETKKWDCCGLSAAAFNEVQEIWIAKPQEGCHELIKTGIDSCGAFFPFCILRNLWLLHKAW